MRILGIDPGLQITGYGMIDYQPRGPLLIDAGVTGIFTDYPNRLKAVLEARRK